MNLIPTHANFHFTRCGASNKLHCIFRENKQLSELMFCFQCLMSTNAQDGYSLLGGLHSVKRIEH